MELLFHAWQCATDTPFRDTHVNGLFLYHIDIDEVAPLMVVW